MRDSTRSTTHIMNANELEAYKVVMDVRKFEIEMYWKRATYFWAFIVIAFGAYGGVLTAKPESFIASIQNIALFTIACVGLVFSVAWYFVNRGSKFWQRNWEYHADLREDAVVGPIYKTVYEKADDRFFKLISAYPFSVSNINHILSLFVVAMFGLLAWYASDLCYPSAALCRPSTPKVVMLAVVALSVFCLYRFGRTTSARQSTQNSKSVTLPDITVRYTRRGIQVAPE